MGPTLRALAMLCGFGLIFGTLRDASGVVLLGFVAVALLFVGLGAWWDAFEARTRQPEIEQPTAPY